MKFMALPLAVFVIVSTVMTYRLLPMGFLAAVVSGLSVGAGAGAFAAMLQVAILPTAPGVDDEDWPPN